MYNLVQAIGKGADLPGPIYEFGAYRVAGQETRGNVRDCFPGKEFVTSDARPNDGIDIVLDLHKLDLPDASVGTAIMLDTIEHVERPWRALEEIHRVLKPGGVVVMTSVMFFPIHFYPDDYWRFTSSGFRALLAPFDDVVLASCGIKTLPHTVVGIGLKAPQPSAMKAQLEKAVESWRQSGSQTWREIVLGVAPPFLLAPAYEWYSNWLARNASKKQG
jgi:SAM-dependent methyltransferase